MISHTFDTRFDRSEWQVDFLRGDSDNPPEEDGQVGFGRRQVNRGEGNAYGSRIEGPGEWHSPVLDLDYAARLVESSTPGHFHLYLDGLTMTWEVYEELLAALAKAGVIQQGYARVSIARKGTFVRKPGVAKEDPLDGDDDPPVPPGIPDAF